MNKTPRNRGKSPGRGEEEDGMPQFIAAFESVLAHEDDRRMLVVLHKAAASDREVRYEELRKEVGIESKQQFKYAFDRLMDDVLIKRRLVPRGERYESYLTSTNWGSAIAKALVSLSEQGVLPADLPRTLAAGIRRAFVGEGSPVTYPIDA